MPGRGKIIIGLINFLIVGFIITQSYYVYKEGGGDKAIIFPAFYLFLLFFLNVIFTGIILFTKLKYLINFQIIVIVLDTLAIVVSICIFEMSN